MQGRLVEYRRLNDRTLDYYRTYTPVALRGRGIAGKLATVTLDYALDHSYTVEPADSSYKRPKTGA